MTDGAKTATPPPTRAAYAIYTADGQAGNNLYTTADAALRAARRKFKAFQTEVAVVWRNGGGIPKVWLAYVDDNGTRKTNHWSAFASEDAAPC